MPNIFWRHTVNKIVLYTKTFSRDLDRLLVSIESVKKFNKDNIPFYISVPSTELSLFNNKVDTEYVHIVADEDIYSVNEQSWKTQQIVKSNFWKLGVCENYVMMDSDSYFIKDFHTSDFMYNDTTPYTVMHEQKDLFEWTGKFKTMLGFDPYNSFVEDRKKIMDVFERTGRIYDFGPGPIIWSAKVWKSLEENYMQPNDLTFSQMIEYCPSEFTWYGEYLLVDRPIDIVPIEPMFKFFHFAQQYQMFKQMGYTEDDFKSVYLGIVMQSNWGAPLKY